MWESVQMGNNNVNCLQENYGLGRKCATTCLLILWLRFGQEVCDHVLADLWLRFGQEVRDHVLADFVASQQRFVRLLGHKSEFPKMNVRIHQ